jgi:hypothetical protein
VKKKRVEKFVFRELQNRTNMKDEEGTLLDGAKTSLEAEKFCSKVQRAELEGSTEERRAQRVLRELE